MAPTGILKVSGTKIVDTDGKEVLLRGVCSLPSTNPPIYFVANNFAGWCWRMGEYGELHHWIPRARIPNPPSSCRGSRQGEGKVLL